MSAHADSQSGRFVIAGGGIGGLATALALAKQGVNCIVLEKAARLGEIGAGIQLGPNAFHCFDYLGVGEEARSMAVFIDQLRLMDATDGEEIASIPLGADFRERYRNPYAVVHRGDLHGVLLRACEEDERILLKVNSGVTGFANTSSGVEVMVDGDGPVRAKALVGADGLWSNVRKQIVGDDPPRVSGHTTYRSVIPLHQMPENLRWNAATLWAGPKCHIVHYPLSDWKYFNLVVTYHNDATEPVAAKPVSKAEVMKGFEHIHELPKEIIEIGEDWKLWVLCDREPVTSWQQGRAILLGDAAHPMLQYMAQGACMALEDAVCLAKQVARHADDLESAFSAYQDIRITRTARVVLASRAMGDHVYHPAGAHAMVRNATLGSWPPTEFYHRLDWLYGAGKGVWE